MRMVRVLVACAQQTSLPRRRSVDMSCIDHYCRHQRTREQARALARKTCRAASFSRAQLLLIHCRRLHMLGGSRSLDRSTAARRHRLAAGARFQTANVRLRQLRPRSSGVAGFPRAAQNLV